MKTLTFKPIISIVRDGFKITAPNDIREELWTLLQLVDGETYIVDRKKGGGTRTQFKVEPYPGYTSEEALIVVALYLYYIAASFDELDLFWSATVKEHLTLIKKYVMFDASFGAGPGFLESELTIRVAEAALDILLFFKAKEALRGKHREIDFEYCEKSMKHRVHRAKGLRRRLKFHPNIDEDEREKYLTTCDNNIKILEESLSLAGQHDKTMGKLEESAAQIVDSLTEEDFGYTTHLNIWEKNIKDLERIKDEVASLTPDFDLDKTRAAEEEIYKVTPPPPN